MRRSPFRTSSYDRRTLCLFHIRLRNSARQCAPTFSRWNERHCPRDAADTSPRSQPPPPSQPAQLGLIVDNNSRKRCLLDTASKVSLWPPSPSSSRLPLSRIRLTAANGTPIQAFGQQRKDIKIGGKSYLFIFLIAQVSRPILGLDFLQNFRMTIDLCKRQLLHSDTSTRFSSASSEISASTSSTPPPSFFELSKTFWRSQTLR